MEISVIIKKLYKKEGDEMKIVVGLGNPGEKYKNTKHNIGFITVDEWAYQNGKQFDKTMFEAVICEGTVNGEKVLL